MRKHLIIAGISRGGKSTICNEILKKFEYTYLPMDMIVRGFQNNFPKIGITHGDRIWNVSKKLAPFLNTCLENMEPNKFLLVDTYHLVPEDYIKFMNKDICEIYFIGYPDISAEERLNIMRMYDDREENLSKTDEDLKRKCQIKIDESKYIQEECEKYHLPFLNLSYDREKRIAEFVESLK